MALLMYRVNHIASPLFIGKVGENKYRSIGVNVTEWLDEYPDGVVRFLFRRPDGEVYVLEEVVHLGNVYIWQPSSADLSVPGDGELELELLSGDVIGKSVKVETRTCESLTLSDYSPETFRSWLDKALLSPMRPEKVADYFYYIRYNDVDYANAREYFKRFKPGIGACSAVSKGNFVGRSFDWTFDETNYFVTRTPAVKGRHAVIGIASSPKGLTEEVIREGGYSSLYDMIPFLLVDGVNDTGLFCEINVVPNDYGNTTGTNQNGEDLFGVMIPRFVLDYASNVDEAIALLEACNIFSPHTEDYDLEFHFMLRDFSKTVVLEFVNNHPVIIDEFVNSKPIVTNFSLYNYDGTHESLSTYAEGIERFAILSDGYDGVESEEDMIALMDSVRYTKAYSDDENPIWYSEFNGNYMDTEFHVNLTKDSPAEDYTEIRNFYKELYERSERDDILWHSVHSVVYDLEKRSLIVRPQEGSMRYRFFLGREGVTYPYERVVPLGN